MSINVDQIDLSLADPSTGLFLTANVYYVEGVTHPDGSPRQLSIGQLVMAICLTRANELESKIIRLMESLNQTTAQLEGLTEVEQAIVDFEYDETSPNGRKLDQWHLNDNEVYGNMDFDEFLHRDEFDNLIGADVHWVYRKGNKPSDSTPYIQGEDLIGLLESKMDEKNSFSQQTMIELQSQTNKRDQAYDMISNILKSLGTVLTNTVNNI